MIYSHIQISTTHWPSDVPRTAVMTQALDYHLLLVTLLELSGVLRLDDTVHALSRGVRCMDSIIKAKRKTSNN